jgi:hypothetical protein
VLNELLTRLWTNVHKAEFNSVHLSESVKLSSRDSLCFRNSLFVFLSIISEKAKATLDESSFSSFKGRALVFPSVVLGFKDGVSPFLTLLDEANECVTKHISMDSSDLQNQMLFDELHCLLSGGHYDLWRLLSPVFRRLLCVKLDNDVVSFLRQIFSLMSKIRIDRTDLLAQEYSDYLYAEHLFAIETSCQKYRDPTYWALILQIRECLRPVVDHFQFDPLLAKHGPGSVSDPSIKDRLTKYRSMSSDSRVDYMLKAGNNGSIGAYTPFRVLGIANRTSRVIYVPKTWKKLRGISAEPVELQFFQQAVFRSLERAIKKSYLKDVINLRDQDISRDMARRASYDRKLSTIDLASASDSVTLQLVKDIFGSSNLTRWLLATRSTHTLINNQRLELSKFAPMGSACCFPVECLIFAGVLLATARQKFSSLRNIYANYRVFGDDIICPSALSQDLIENLTMLGFTVNTAKSFTSGDFRESCGMDAWRGSDVTPLKLKDFSFCFDGSEPCSFENRSRIVSYINSLWSRGYLHTRSFLLKKFLSCNVNLSRQSVLVSQTCVFGSSGSQFIQSANADNFHLRRSRFDRLFRSMLVVVDWKPVGKRLSLEEQSFLDEVNYLEYLRKNYSDVPVFASYDLDWFRSVADGVPDDSVEKSRMVPTSRHKDMFYSV